MESSPRRLRANGARGFVKSIPARVPKLVGGRVVTVLLASLLVTLGAMAVLVERTREDLEQERETQVALLSVADRATELHVAKWKLIASGGSRDAGRALFRAEEQLGAALRVLAQSSAGARTGPTLGRLIDAIHRPLERASALLARRRAVRARAIDESVIDPLFARLDDALHRETRATALRVGATSRTADHVTRAVLVLGIVVVGLLVIALLWTTRRHVAGVGERRFAALVRASADAILIVAPNMEVRYAAPSIETVLGFAPSQVPARFSDLVHPDERAELEDFYADLGTSPGTQTTTHWRLRHADESWRHGEVTSSNLAHDPDIAGFVLNVRDVSERRRLEEELRHRALHDPLTGLANRALFAERLDQALRARTRSRCGVAILFVDLDDFKAANDAFGHLGGDELLRTVARRLRTVVRDEDTVARLGGDEFAVLMERVEHPEQTTAVAERARRAVMEPLRIGADEVRVSASVGIAIARTDDPGASSESLLRDADVAMYLAKEADSGYEVYSPTRDPHTGERLVRVAELRRVLEQAADQVELAFQPKLDLRTGRVPAVEALVRWRHPERGLLMPGEFVPLAEQSGLITSLTRCVLALAVRAHSDWERNGLRLGVAVNLSMADIRNERFPDELAALLEQSGVSPEQLTLEVTETMVAADPERATHVLHRLERLGVRLSVDDFGTGWSSLVRLKQLPLHEVKIDRAFVRDMLVDVSDQAIVRSTVGLAEELGLAVVAEGVEHPDAIHELRAMGCGFAQGYEVARPMDAVALAAWLERWNSGRAQELASALEVNTRKTGNRALAETQRWFREVFDSMAVGMALTSLDGRYLRVNEALCDLLGRTRVELLSTSPSGVTDPDDRSLDRENVEVLLQGDGSSRTITKRYVRPDGTRVWAEVTVTLVRDGDGQPLHFLSLARDIGPGDETQASEAEPPHTRGLAG